MAETTFKQAYGVLQNHAESLRNQQEPNIDDLLTIVTESVQAYNVCKARIDAVEKALEQALNGAGVGSRSVEDEPPPLASSSKTQPFDDMDVPF
ncbi:hypothetical protein GPA27_16380 [Aromatoleum toluolicum]|uniref:Uncharacterized protein n=1 Tax=Aromatoleum toluolicum TaxID=90060 RepID=A0ABX1NI05_9RHOO|nr:exodeoxyribonuclease VII small subunit [Aromatoleum toluolicum]NMF98957.1 hypothetical protein [Aromatoleum toluolicum]